MIPWDQTPEYLAASITTVLPGGPTTYSKIPNLGSILHSPNNRTAVVPRRAGNTSRDVTSFHPGQVSWSKDAMPSIIYMLRPPESWYKYQFNTPLPRQKLAPDGQFMFAAPDGSIVRSRSQAPIQGHHRLLDFKLLPDKVNPRT